MDKISLSSLTFSLSVALLSQVWLSSRDVEATRAVASTLVGSEAISVAQDFFCYVELPSGETRDLSGMCGTEDVNESAPIRPEDVEILVYVDDPQVVERIRASVERDERFVILPNGYKIEAASLVEGQIPNIYDPEGNRVVPGQQTTWSPGWQRVDSSEEAFANYDPLEEFYK